MESNDQMVILERFVPVLNIQVETETTYHEPWPFLFPNIFPPSLV